ncbi:MAG: PHP domain-containing protein [Candidatus Rokuibacteriota bacterium]
MLDKVGVAGALREIGLLLEAEGGQPYRARAYARGARAVEALSDPLPALIAEGRLLRVRDIGPHLAATIGELVRTGQSTVLGELRQRVDLKRLATQRAVVLLHEAATEGDGLLAYVRAHPAVERAELAGDLRRRTETVSRLELVAAAHEPRAVLEHLAGFPLAAEVLERNADRIVLRLAGGLSLGALLVPPRAFALALHRLTGSDAHLAKLETTARERGIVMDTTGLRRRGRGLVVRSEADVYRHLGLAPIVPELREDAGEVEAAATGTLPVDLITLADIRGMVHCHTTYSDGKDSVEAMARAADALGMQYLTITDHSVTASYARGLALDRLRRQWDDIARVQEKVTVQLLRGTESDILADGSLDYPDAVLEQLDVVIASIHHRHRMDASQMTRRIVTAMRHPCFKIWGHALGRYVLRRPPIDCHVEEILDAMAAARAAVEVNGDPHRLDMEPRWIREARRRGLRFVVSSDAHSVADLSYLRWGVDMARRGWLTRRDVLNTLGPHDFRAAVHP